MCGTDPLFRSFFTSVLTSILTTSKFLPHEYMVYVLPVVHDDATTASHSPTTVTIEAAHALAFHTDLGASLFANPHTPISLESMKSFAKEDFTSGNVAIVSTSINSARLAALVNKALADATLPTSSSITAAPSKYFCGSM